jgi:parallel beta-helix repeat protein
MARARSGKSKRHFTMESIEPRVLFSKTIYVDVNASGATHDGTSWNSAFTDLQQGLAAAVSGDEIHVADGTYKPTSGADRTISFALKSGVNIYGGYAGYGTPNPDARDIAAYTTILSGDVGAVGNTDDNSYHVLTAKGISVATVVDGFSVTLGFANGGETNQKEGAGLFVTGSSSLTPSLLVTNCMFTQNTASWGGAMYNYSSSPTLTNCSFSANTASSAGGAMYNDTSSSPTLTNCIFSANTTSYSGGGMYNQYSSSPSLTNCTFCANLALSSGGAMESYSSSPVLSNCIVWGSGNSPIDSSSSTPTITYCDIEGGYAGMGNINVDPQFVRSPWTGPDGVFGTADDDYGDLRLRSHSVCLDAGSNAAVPGGVTTDLAGNPRIQNGMVDLGACEGGFTTPNSKLLYVDRNCVGTNNGTSWANAYTSLQSAILAARDGDTIRVADGSYKPTSGTDRTMSFALRSGVSLYGGYAGYGAPNPDARDIAAYATILSGGVGVVGSDHVVIATGIGVATVMDGLTVTLGYAIGGGTKDKGAGLFVAGSSSLTLINCTFNGNGAYFGGGIYVSSFSSPTLNNCIFKANEANSGGGIYNDSSSSPTLTNCTFSGQGNREYCKLML